MKKYKRYLLFASIFLMPNLVFADTENGFLPVEAVLFMEAFVSIHISVFVLKPLATLISEENSKKIFWILFIIRVVILLFFDFFVTTKIAIFDFLLVFIGAFLIIPIFAVIKKKNPYVRKQIVINSNLNNETLDNQIKSNQAAVLNCVKCGKILKSNAKFCSNCGALVEGNNVNGLTPPKVLVNSSNFDPIFNNSEDKLLEIFINKELAKARIDSNSKLFPNDILKRKNILNIIFSILVFVYVSLIFFHFPIYTYVIGIIVLFVFFMVTRKYNLMKYLKKEIKARPSEKISNIVMNVKISFVTDSLKKIRMIIILVAIILPLFIFMKPRIMYEKVDNGYAVRFYTFGLTNFKTAIIPETYKGEKVVSLRGNTFSNMPFLENVTLPNTITEIRGQAFKNDFNLVSVNIPTNLEYLGGGAFYNCSKIEKIILPDTLTYMGGEVFYGASSLKYVQLSNNLTEIRGSSFENCTSLKSITIPDKVTRIGGHAFYGNSSLSEVLITENSELTEIGSSAFRLCKSLKSITIPRITVVNERAFKESPTIVNRYGSFINNSTTSNPTFNTTTNLNTTKEYILYVNQEKIINDNLSMKLVSFTDEVNDKSIFVGKKGQIVVKLDGETYTFDFNTSGSQVYKFTFAGHYLEVLNGQTNYITVKYQ